MTPNGTDLRWSNWVFLAVLETVDFSDRDPALCSGNWAILHAWERDGAEWVDFGGEG